MAESEKTTNSQIVLSVRIKNDKQGPQTGDVILDGSSVNEWFKGGTYEEGDVVIYNSQFYQSLELQEDSQSFDYTKWKQIGIPDIIVPEFETNTYYSQGQVVVYDEKLYRAKEDFTSSNEFYPEDWESISGETYQFTSEDRTVIITINDDTIDFSVSNYVDSIRLALEALIENKVEKEDGKGLSSNDFTEDEKLKLQSLAKIVSIGDNLTLDSDGRLDAGFSVSFDAFLDKNSTNGVQNKVITEAVEDLQDDVSALSDRITTNTNNISSNSTKISKNESDIAQLKQDVADEDALIHTKVDKVDGKELSSNDYTDADQTKLNNLADIRSIGQNLDLTNGILSAPDQIVLQPTTGTSTTDGMTQKAITEAINQAASGITTTLATVATTGDYDDLNNLPTGETLEIQKNGTMVGTFTTLSGSDSTINLNIPVTASDVNALPASTKYAADLNLSIDNTTFIITAQLVDQTGNNIGTERTIDLPLESVVVSGKYDKDTKKVILTLKDGSTIDFSIADLINGLQSEITDYTTGKKYIVGDICILDGSFYRCISAIASAPATMNDSDWEQVGGADAILIKIDENTWTWTSDVSWTDIQEGVGKKLFYFNLSSAATNYLIANRQSCESSSRTDFYIESRIYSSVASQHLIKLYSLNLTPDGSVVERAISYSAASDEDGKAKQTVGTLTINDAEGTSLGTFNGSSDQTITLPESFDILTNAEIDSIWENA